MEDVKDVKFVIVRRFGVISDGLRGWSKELNLVAWNDREPKLDIREWSEDHTRMGKGVTLTREEGERLHEYLGTVLKS
jgi:Uncharacterized protein conserved in bacteria